MSYGSNHENPSTYIDNVKVKISEKYKPPRKINLAMTYSQRLTLNKQIQDNIPDYSFDLENSALEKIKDLRNSKANDSELRRARLEEARKERERRKLELLERLERENEKQEELKTVEKETAITTNLASSENYLSPTTSDTILMPTMSTYSDILTPMPPNLNYNQKNGSPANNRPFNISDFEDDTSSPFDNVALKSINDMEELAKVLKSETSYKSNVQNNYVVSSNSYSSDTQTYPNYQMAGVSQIQSTLPVYSNQYMNNYDSYNIPNTYGQSIQTPSSYDMVNGYYYPTNVESYNHLSYNYGSSGYATNTVQTSQPIEMKNCKSVPDIVQSLQDELKNTHLKTGNGFSPSKAIPTPSMPSRPKCTTTESPVRKVKERLENPFGSLSRHEQELCQGISSMGFPLDRVARACKAMGEDQKKIVDHLLAMTELLDLGFLEKDISAALVEYNNDRDKALDKLIS